MKNFLIFIFFSIVLYLLSLLVASWDDGYYIANDNNIVNAGVPNKKIFYWGDEFHFPSTLYARAKYKPKVTGKTFYVDPINGSMQNDGSLAAPWKTLEAVFKNNLIQHYRYKETPYKIGGEKVIDNPDAPIKGGDALVLLTGEHGKVSTGKGGFYVEKDAFITIKAEKGSRPQVSGLELQSASYLYFEGIDFARESTTENKKSIVTIAGHNHHGEASNIIINNCSIRTIGNAESWSATQWNERAASGLSAFADNIVVRGCSIENVKLGIAITGDNSIAIGNSIYRFCLDGMRGNGDNLVFEGNKVIGSYKVDDNHDDGFQAFLTGGKSEYINMIFKDNTLIQSESKNRKLRQGFQGVGCFDGPYKNWKIIGNTVVTDDWHGITIMGGVDCVIEDNLILPLNYGAKEGPPWIRVVDGKKGTPTTGCSVRNNRAMSYTLGTGVMSLGNVTIRGEKEVDRLVQKILAKNRMLAVDYY